jgi:hypothetical protein
MLDLHLRKLRHGALSALTLVSVFGCSLTIDPDLKQCTQDSDCAARGSKFTGTKCVNSACQAVSNWACLDTPRQVSTGVGSFQVTVQLLDGTSLKPIQGVEVRACHKVDVECTAPAGSTVSDGDGQVTLSVPGETGSYLSLKHDGVVPSLYFFNPTPTADTSLEPVYMIKTEILPVMTALIGAEQLSDRGLVYITSFNCAGSQTAGVSLAVAQGDAQTIPYYIIDSLPNKLATATDKDGWGGFFNLKPGTATITGQLQDTQRVLGAISLIVRPGTVTYGRMVPVGK